MFIHGLSHFLAVGVTVIGAGYLVNLAAKAWPAATAYVIGGAAMVQTHLGLPFAPQTLIGLALAGIMAAVWGVLFSLVHRD